MKRQTCLQSAFLFTAGALALSGPVHAQDPVQIQAQSYRVVVDNDKVRVLSFKARPGMGVCGAGRHSHPGHVTVLLTPATVKVTQDGKTAFRSLKAGDAFWEPPVTHEVENYGSSEVRSLIMEVKTPASSR